MVKKVIDVLSSIPISVVSGIFVVLSFVLSKLAVALPADPAWVSVVISGLPMIYHAVMRLKSAKGINKISSALLISIAMIAAIIIGDVFAAGEVVFIMAVGEILEDATTARAKKGIKRLIDLAPTKGRIIRNGNTEMVSASEIIVGDVLRVFPGEAIPADGIILKGNTSIDEAIMTGESLPADKKEGDSVFCGTINQFGSIDIKATKADNDSSLQKHIRMVKEAENKKAPIARMADKAASLLVPVALAIAVITGIVTGDIVRAVTVLVVFCPCSLVLATPTAIMAAVGQAAKKGVIIKSGEALEKMGKADTVALDKTGTLTLGKLSVSDIVSFIPREELLKYAAAAEAKSEHPLAWAITDFVKNSGIAVNDAGDFKMLPGKGVKALALMESVLCGSEALMKEEGVILSEEAEAAVRRLSGEGKAVVIAAKGKMCIGVIALCDELREGAAELAASLDKLNVKTVLLTGDNKRAAKYFADMAGIADVRGSLLPEDKVAAVEQLKKEGAKVCMAGDGVNDAPALKTADVSVAMGKIGSDIAMDAADITLVSDDIRKLVYLKKLARGTTRTINFGIVLSMVINFAAVVLSVLGIMGPTVGALVHNGGSIVVILIAALLYERKFD